MAVSTTEPGSNPTDSISSTERAAAIEALSRRFRLPLLRFFEKRAGRIADVEDLVQDVFVRLAGDVNLESIDRMEAYLFQTAANLLRDRHRRQVARATAAHEPFEETLHGMAEVSPERAILGKESIERLIAALYELPERTRDIFALYHFENLPHAEIGRRLGIAVSTIEKHMGRANAHLLKRVDRKS